MDIIKVGKFIADCRKEKQLTQIQLAEKLNITNRAVSKWETGKSMPDTSVMMPLCEILGITVNELLCGERISVENYKMKAEENLIELQNKKAEAEADLSKVYKILMAVYLVLFVVNMVINYFFPEISGMREILGCITIIAGVLIFGFYFKSHYEIKLK